MSKIKDKYNYESIKIVALDIKEVYNDFQVDCFLNSIFNDNWDKLKLKEAIILISKKLKEYLPDDYEVAIGIIDKVVMKYGMWEQGFGGFFPLFIELHVDESEHWDISLNALARYTRYASSEIAIRSFIIKNSIKMMEVMYQWSLCDDKYIRRLSSEGSRLYLPWAQSIDFLKDNPMMVLKILDQLKNDESLIVQRSVANSINDLSKLYPDLVVSLVETNIGKNKITDWILKHGSRTLLKQSNVKILSLF